VTVLPASRIGLVVNEPTSADELFVVETALAPPSAWLELAARVGRPDEGGELAWMQLPAVDLAAAALAIRRAWIGDAITADAGCPDPGCGERMEVAFGIGEYLEHHRPRPSRRATQTSDAAWYVLTGIAVRFRIPTVADLLDALQDPEPERALAGRCVDPPDVRSGVARRVNAALSALAPRLDDLVGGACPACGAEVEFRFDPLTYTFRELKDLFSGIHREIHALASAYGWPEEEILTIPRRRRVRYASIIADDRSVA
jgi:hypothetical protein